MAQGCKGDGTARNRNPQCGGAMSFPQIAKELGISAATAYKTYWRGMQKLKKRAARLQEVHVK